MSELPPDIQLFISKPEAIEVFVGYWLSYRLLDPTLVEAGERIRDNIARVIRHATRFLGAERAKRSGEVPLKVLKSVCEAAAVCENELESEYLGGVLASSRTDMPNDDRAATLTSLVGRLSTYQLRAHYIAYASAQRVLANSAVELRFKYERVEHARFYLPVRDWRDGMAMTGKEVEHWEALRGHAMHGLRREHLYEQGYTFADPDILRRFSETDSDYPEAGFLYTLSPLGIELFTAAHGFHDDPFTAFLGPSEIFAHREVQLGTGCRRVSELPSVRT